ncbi:hypothetical protein [Actinomadura rayongensis]|uniref:TPM domain-containing protein n=1 Tax=Actinomadura rayongensis TaxID=1429076 RepID=A0A6I4WH07_9ACTN|nr:hypothetical protein [Actinomadura rayongensis]MXQ67605.1 hypothetical protein [Actinomadura rayongensis]
MRARSTAVLAALAFGALPVVPAGAAPSPPAAPFPAYAYHRLDRVGAALARDPVFVDPDLAPWIGAADRRRVRAATAAAARALGTPVYVVVIPNPSDAESAGDDRAFLAELRDRTGRDGLYLIADTSGRVDAAGFRVPRDLSRDLETPSLDDPEPDFRRPFAGLADRLVRRLDRARNGAAVPPETTTGIESPPAFGHEDDLVPADGPEFRAPFLTGLLLAGPFGALVLYALWRIAAALVARRARPRSAVRSGGPVRPGARWLRRTARRDVAALRAALGADGGENRGLDFATGAYDAAQILLDDVADDRARAIDLVGVIVLARQGREALDRNVASPPPPCWINPLHGASAEHRRTDVGGRGRRALCGSCAKASTATLRSRVLHVPGPAGAQPHHDVPGLWRDAAYGARTPLSPLVLESLGVD